MTLSRSSILLFFIFTSIYTLLVLLNEYRKGRVKKVFLTRSLWIYGVVLIVSSVILWKYFGFVQGLLDAQRFYLDDEAKRNARLFALGPSFNMICSDPIHALIGFNKIESLRWADNAFSNTLLRGGVLGFLFYIPIWGLSLLTCVRRLYRDKNPNTLYYMGLYILLFQFLYGFSAPINQDFPHNLYFWLVIAMIVWLESSQAVKRVFMVGIRKRSSESVR